MAIIIIIITIFGLIVGSFLSVCIYRIPAGREDLLAPASNCQSEGAGSETAGEAPEGESDFFRERTKGEEKMKGVNSPPRSICLTCGEQLKWYHNIPLFSWLALRGRCAFCRTRIPFRYPLVELLSAISAVCSYLNYGLTLSALVVYLFICALIVISFIDYDYYIIPNSISIRGFFIGCGVAVLNQFTGIFGPPVVAGILPAFWGVLVGAGFLWGFAELFYLIRKKEGLGMGDVKLLGMTGVFFGPQAAIYTIFLGSILGSILGGVLMLFAGREWSKPLPFGPYLALGTVAYLFSGEKILEWWISLLGGM